MDDAMGQMRGIQPREERIPLSERVDRRISQLTQEAKARDDAFQLEMKRQRLRFKRMRRFNREQSGESRRRYEDLRRRREQRNERVRKANEYKLRQKRIAIRKAYVEKLLEKLFRLSPQIAGGVASSTALAVLVKEFNDWIYEEQYQIDPTVEKAQNVIKEVENDLGTNSGTMNPEVRKNFGKESFLETSQGDLHYSEEDNILVVSYRGTDFSRLFDRPDLALIDIINDLNMGTRQYMGLSLHAGFLDMFLESLPEIKEFINQYMDNDTIVYTTGHSAGSPSAVLLAYTINQHRGNHNCICYTFGSPRFVIEGKSAERINSVVPHNFRINTDNDLVPYLPPRIKPNPIPQYIHVGTEYVFSSEGAGYGINKEDTRTVRNLKDLGHILYKIMFLYTGASNYVLSDGSSLLGRLLDAKKLLNPITFFQEVSRTGKSILFNLDLIENPFVDRSRYNFRNSPMRTSRAMREQMGLAIDRIKEGFKNSWGDKLDKINSILYRSTDRFIFQLDQEAYELAWDLTGDAFKTSRQTLRIKSLMVRAGIPESAVDNYLTSIFDVTYNRGRNFKQTLISYYGERIGTAIGNTFGNYLTFRTFMINCGFATGLALVFNFFIQGQYNRFLGHRIVNYDKILSTFTDGKMELGHPIKSENEIIGNNDVKTSDGVYKRTDKKHFNKTVYESDGMNFTSHFHRGEIYMNYLPSNMSDAIMGYYLYKPEEFGDGAVKGFVIY